MRKFFIPPTQYFLCCPSNLPPRTRPPSLPTHARTHTDASAPHQHTRRISSLLAPLPPKHLYLMLPHNTSHASFFFPKFFLAAHRAPAPVHSHLSNSLFVCMHAPWLHLSTYLPAASCAELSSSHRLEPRAPICLLAALPQPSARKTRARVRVRRCCPAVVARPPNPWTRLLIV